MTEATYLPFVPPPGEDELPYSDGEPMETERHVKQQSLLTSSLERAWMDRQDFYVGGNMFIYFSHLQIKKNDFRGPDVFVVLDTIRRERKSWVAWEEGGRLPDVVIELISESTAAVDRGEKKRIYEKVMRVSNYYLFDPLSGELEGYELDHTTRTYRPITPEANGDLVCPMLGLKLGIRRGRYIGLETDWLRWIDADGRVLLSAEEDADEAKRRAQEMEQRAQEQASQREDAERKLREALAEIDKLKSGRG